MDKRLRKLISLAMLSAIAYVVMVLIKVPVVLWLKYEPKDIIIVISGFIYGPLSSFIISALVSLVEMVTASETGIMGCIMNIISSCTFACTAALIYKHRRTISGAVIGLLSGVVVMVSAMLLWNYLLTPIYMGYPREAVAELLLPAFLPFNLLKGGLNMAITLLIYKPIVTSLRKARLIDSSSNPTEQNSKIGIILATVLLLATCIFFVLVLKGIV